MTITYIMEKGSAGVEAYRKISHLVANFYGDPDRRRRHKEMSFIEDMRVLVQEMIKEDIHTLSHKKSRLVPAQPSKGKGQKNDGTHHSAVIDVFDLGAQSWNNRKFTEFIKSATFDPELGYPIEAEPKSSRVTTKAASVLDNVTVFVNCVGNVLTHDTYIDLHGDEVGSADGGAVGALGGKGEFETGDIVDEYDT